MPRLKRLSESQRASRVFETRTHAWQEVGLGAEVDRSAAKRARGEVVVLAAALAGVLVLFGKRQDLFPGWGTEARIATVVAIVILGWALARALSRGIAPALFRRMDPGTAGTVGFLVRLLAIILMVVIALRIAGLKGGSLAIGGAMTAVVLGLAAQQTLGNLFAGLVILSARPFRVGDRVRLVGGALAGQVEGIVSSQGLLHATLLDQGNRVMVPNNMLLNLAIIPIREPERVEVRARFDAGTTPSHVQELLSERITVPTRYPPHIALEELDRDEVILRITATPLHPSDGAKLADEVLSAALGGNGNSSSPAD